MKTKAYFETWRALDRKISFIINRNADCAEHFHSNIEIIGVVSGGIEMTVRGESRLLTAGMYAVADSYEIHSFRTPEASLLHVWIFPAELLSFYKSGLHGLTFASPFLTDTQRSDEISFILNRLGGYVGSSDSLTAYGYIQALLGIFSEELTTVPREKSESSELLIRDILIYLDGHFTEKLSASLVAKHFGYNKDYISRAFNARINCGFNAYVNLLRVRYSRGLITDGEHTLDEAAALSGFGSVKTFRRAFTGYFGKTPAEYRREAATGEGGRVK